MAVTSLPRILGQLLAAEAEAQADPFRILLVGQLGTDGAAVTGQYYEDIEKLTNQQVYDLFGTKGELTGRIMRSRSIIKGRSAITVIGLTADIGGVAADLDITVTGEATEDGLLKLKVIDAESFTIGVDVLDGETANEIAIKIKAKIDELEMFPATSGTVTTGVFTLTANDVGTIPNKYTVKHITNVAGVTVVAGQFSGGATNPSTTGIFDNVQTVRFHAVSWAWESDFTELKNLLEARNILNNSVLHGCGFIGLDDTEANITAIVEVLNSPNLLFFGNRQITGESVEVTPADWRVAEFISIEALRLTPGVAISEFVTTSAAKDTIGNVGLASLAYYNTPMAKTDIADPNLLFSEQEQVNLKNEGFSIVGVNSSKTASIMAEVVTTYKLDKLGNPEISFKYLNYVRTGYYSLELFFKALKINNSQSRLTEGGLKEGRLMQNKKSIEAQCLEVFTILGGSAYVLLQSGLQAEGYFMDNLVVELDIANGKVTLSGKLPIITQIRDTAMTFQMSFSVGG